MLRTTRAQGSRPLRRAVRWLALAASANALLVAAALAPRESLLVRAFPLASVGLPERLIVAAAAFVLAVLAALAAHGLSRVTPHSRRLALGACVGTLLNVPFGTVVGLVALATLEQPRVRRLFAGATA